MKELIMKNILAMIPAYVNGEGNCTLIYIEDGNSEIVKYSIRTVIRKFCAHYRLDLKASNRQFKEKFNINCGIPIPISKDKIYIQVKVRAPIGKDDGAMGFIRLDAIKGICGTKGEATILLKNGVEIKSLCSQKTIKKNINIGELAMKLYEDEIMRAMESIENYRERTLQLQNLILLCFLC